MPFGEKPTETFEARTGGSLRHRTTAHRAATSDSSGSRSMGRHSVAHSRAPQGAPSDCWRSCTDPLLPVSFDFRSPPPTSSLAAIPCFAPPSPFLLHPISSRLACSPPLLLPLHVWFPVIQNTGRFEFVGPDFRVAVWVAHVAKIIHLCCLFRSFPSAMVFLGSLFVFPVWRHMA